MTDAATASGELDRRPSAGQTLTAGLHLPQAGPAASGEAVRQVAVLAEQLGYGGVWLSDHLVVQQDATYPPSAYIYDPLISMAWAAAATEQVEIGATVLVAPHRRPVVLGKMLATLDLFSGGRIIAGLAGGYVAPEFAALGVPMDERGPRTDETIEIIQAMWQQDPITAEFPVHGLVFDRMRAKPQPERQIPIWIGGKSKPAYRRAVRVGHGWHGGDVTPGAVDLAATAERVRQVREFDPPEGFVYSLRVSWDGLEDDHDSLLTQIDRLRELGFTHIVAEPRQRTLDGYRRSSEALAEVFRRAGAISG